MHVKGSDWFWVCAFEAEAIGEAMQKTVRSADWK